MKSPDKHNEDINAGQDGISAQNSDVNAKKTPADDGFKTGKKSHGMTWEMPMDEQTFDNESLSEDKTDEEGD
jgi:hypothetical protein